MEILQFIRKKQFWAIVVVLLVLNNFFMWYGIQKKHDMECLSDRQITKQEFQALIDNREKAFQQATEFQIFSDEKSFAEKNRIKEQRDYKNSFRIQVERGNNRVITSVFSNYKIGWFLLLFVCYLILQFHKERENAMWYVMHSMPKGRGRLAAKRCGALAVLTIAFGLILYCNSFVWSSIILGGGVRWNRGIQSIEAFVTIPQPYTILQFCALFVFVHILGCCCIGFFLFFIFSFCREKLLAFLWIAMIGIVEYILTLLPIQSNLVLAKIWNLFSTVNMNEYLATYRNIPLPFDGIMETLPLCMIACVFTGFVGFFGSIYVNHRIMPGKKESVIHKMLAGVLDYLRKLLSVLPNIGLELYKQLIGQRKWCVLVLLCMICFYSEKPGLYFGSPKEVFLERFYTKFSGIVENEEADAYLNNIKEEIMETEKLTEKVKEDFRNGMISSSEYEKQMHTISASNSKIEGYRYICKERTRLKKLQSTTGKTMEYVNPRPYEPLCHPDYWGVENKTAVFAMFVLLLLLFDSGSYEKRIGMSPIICSTAKGCNMILRKKISIAIIYGVITWVLIYGSDLWNVLENYGGFSGIFAPVQSLEFLDGIAFHCPIWLYLVCLYLLRLLVLVLFSLFIFSISCLFSQLSTFSLVFCIGIFPSLLYYLGIEQMGIISFSKILAFLHYPGRKMENYCVYIGILILSDFVGLLLGKKFCFKKSHKRTGEYYGIRM